MLPREKRLSRAAFASVNRGKRLISGHFSITTTRSSEGRAAAVVSKNVVKKAADRHRLKRRMLTVARPYVNGKQSFIMYARAGSATLPYKALQQELNTLLRDAIAV